MLKLPLLAVLLGPAPLSIAAAWFEPGALMHGVAARHWSGISHCLSPISFGGVPGVLSDLHDFVVTDGWLCDQDFANYFAVVQAFPGPNMIMMMSFIGWKVGGMLRRRWPARW